MDARSSPLVSLRLHLISVSFPSAADTPSPVHRILSLSLSSLASFCCVPSSLLPILLYSRAYHQAGHGSAGNQGSKAWRTLRNCRSVAGGETGSAAAGPVYISEGTLQASKQTTATVHSLHRSPIFKRQEGKKVLEVTSEPTRAKNALLPKT